MLELTPDPAPLYREATDAEFIRITAPLWAWLDELHPALWRKGKLFPASAAETRQLLDDGELAMAISFNPQEAQSAAQIGALPPASRRSPWQRGRSPTATFSPSPSTPTPARGQGGRQLPAKPCRSGAQGRPGVLG
ncbi:hypothetical protein FT670_07380 [Aeromonas jandaei]|nr:hypothetical protein FT670_07380 [Aeromonas jandaei]